MTDSPFSVVLADDHPLVLSGLWNFISLDPRFNIVGVCNDGEAALKAIRELAPQIAVVDLQMPKRNGLSVIRAVAADGVATRMILLAAALGDGEVHEAIKLGVAGILLKDGAPEALMDCLRTVAAGDRWLPAELIDDALKRESKRREGAESLKALLTGRERQIALMLLDEASNKEIGSRLRLSLGTVKIHLYNIYRKVGVTSRAGLVRAILPYRAELADPSQQP